MLGAMKSPGIVRRHPELRWLALIVVLVVAGAIIATSVSGALHEDAGLPVTTASQLIKDVRSPYEGGYYGTVDTSIKLGLPGRLASALAGAAPAGNLLRGSHRLRYWYGDPAHQRVAVINETSEVDVFRNGSRTWQWDTSTHVARRGTVSTTQDGVLPLRLDNAAALTPPQLAAHLLAAVGSQSHTALRGGDSVGSRPTYQLVLTPEIGGTRISEIDIDVDGHEGVPLRVRVFATQGGAPVLDVSFEDDLRFAPPDRSNFVFRLPESAVVRGGPAPSSATSALDDIALLGTGWHTVASYSSDVATGTELGRIVYRLLDRAAARVHGSWGVGRLVVTPAMSVLVTRNGRVYAGPVTPTILYRVARG